MSAAIGAASTSVQWRVIDDRKGDLIDRLGAAFQRARLWKRRARRQLVEARAGDDKSAIHAALRRYQRACHWRTVFYRTYVNAVFAVHC